MLFDVVGLVDESSAQAIASVIRGLDPQAEVTTDVDRGRLLANGLFSEKRLTETLRAAGYPTSVAPLHAEGTTCCGGCS
jgi:hypothetical protein